jgi:HEAT repeat protein
MPPGALRGLVGGPAQTIDLPVTLLRFIDIPAPPQMEGRDLGPWLAGAPAEALEPVFIEYRHKKAIVDGRYKLIHDTVRNYSELYDLRRDPQELRNLVGREPAIARRLRGRLRGAFGPGQAERLKPEERARALLQQSKRGDAVSVEELVWLYDRVDPTVRRDIMSYLSGLRVKSALPLLKSACSSDDPGIAIPAHIGAALLGNALSLDRVEELLERPDLPPALRRNALIALARFRKDPAVVSQLSELLGRSQDIYERFSIIEALGASGDPAATPALRRQLRTLRTRMRAINALGSVHAVAAVSDLVRVLETDAFVSARRHAAYALGRIGGSSALPALRRSLLQEPEPAVVEAVIWALWRLNGIPNKGLLAAKRDDAAATCDNGVCEISLGLRCAPVKQLLLVLEPPSVPVEIRCGGEVKSVIHPAQTYGLRGVDALSLPAAVVTLSGSGTLVVRSSNAIGLRYAGLRRAPAMPPERSNE